MDLPITTWQLQDGTETFTVTVLEAKQPTRVGLFAVGRGGNPLRHLSLLRSVANHGCTIVAPHLAMLTSFVPTKEELDTRIRRLELALDGYARVNQPIIGIGHSIGTVALLALAGGEARTLSGHRVVSGSRWKFDRLVLLAPPADFFRDPGALKSVAVRTYVRAGGKDTVTPPDQVVALSERLAKQTQVEFYLDENAGHFSYMDELPPHVVDSQPNRNAFLSALAQDVAQFVNSPS